MIRTRRARRRGATAVVAVLSLVPILGVTAMVIDGGMLMAERRRAQAAADAASFAALRTYDKVSKSGSGRDPWAAAQAAALAYASPSYARADGSANDAIPWSVTIAQPSSASDIPRYKDKNPDLIIQATVTLHQQRFFGSGTVDVVARSTALRITSSAASPSLLVLSPSAGPSLSVAGSARINAEGEVQVKSNAIKPTKSSNAVDVNNMGHIKAPSTSIVGGYQLSSSGYFDNGTSSVKTGSDASGMVDPILGSKLADPDPSGMANRTSPSGWNPTNPFPISPGVYPNGLVLNSGGMNYTMSPGVYYIKSGRFEVSNGVRVTGTGVMIYLYDGDVSIQGGQGISLTAPTSGPYEGIGIWQRSVYNPATDDYSPTHSINVANGTSNKITDGMIYAPGATMAVAGGSGNTYGNQLIVNKLNISNNAVITLPKPTSRSAAVAKFYLAR